MDHPWKSLTDHPWKNLPWQVYAAYTCLPLLALDIWAHVHFQWLRGAQGNWALVLVMTIMIPILIGGLLFTWGSEIVHIKYRQQRQAEADEQHRYLQRLRDQYPPSKEVIRHLSQLGYGRVAAYIIELEKKVAQLERRE